MASTFRLEVVSMDGPEFQGDVQRITLRTIDGDVAILEKHTNYCTAIGMGTAKVIAEDGTERSAACIGGMITMMNNVCRVIPTTWEWSEDIDVARAEDAKKRAEERLQSADLSKEDKVRAEAKLYRALVRLQSAGK